MASKDEFKATVERMTAQLEAIDTVYPALIARVEPFDRELAAKIRASMNADAELLRYVRSKAEAREVLPAGVFALLGAR